VEGSAGTGNCGTYVRALGFASGGAKHWGFLNPFRASGDRPDL